MFLLCHARRGRDQVPAGSDGGRAAPRGHGNNGHVPLEFVDFARVFNFRDLGGHPTEDGRTVRHGVLFRSDNLGSLQEEDRERFQAMGIRTIVDLRKPREIEKLGGRAPEWACSVWHNVPLKNPAWLEEDYSEQEGPVAYLIARYLESAEATGGEYARVLSILADPETGPVAVHCMGGRDRTGMVFALLLDLLGVPDDVIAADYQFTELATERFMAWFRSVNPEAAEFPPYLTVTPAEVILTVLERLRDKYGSIEAYVREHGLSQEEIARLRELYLSPVDV
jgi:protein tyrosine/serine phosphatase